MPFKLILKYSRHQNGKQQCALHKLFKQNDLIKSNTARATFAMCQQHQREEKKKKIKETKKVLAAEATTA